MRQLALILRRLSIVTLAFLAISAVSWAAEAGACNPGRTPNSTYSYFDGWRTYTNAGQGCLTGSLADIQVKNPYVETGKSSAWTALFNNVSGEIGQVGWLNTTPNYTRFNFAEFAVGTTIHDFKEWVADPVGSSPEYKVTYSSGYFHLFENGTNYYNFSDSTYQGCWAEQAAEVQNWNSQMPGVASDHEQMIGSKILGVSGWVTTNSWSNTTPSPFVERIDGVYGFSPPFEWQLWGSPNYNLAIWDTCS
jgi:hypothetical protein